MFLGPGNSQSPPFIEAPPPPLPSLWRNKLRRAEGKNLSVDAFVCLSFLSISLCQSLSSNAPDSPVDNLKMNPKKRHIEIFKSLVSRNAHLLLKLQKGARKRA